MKQLHNSKKKLWKKMYLYSFYGDVQRQITLWNEICFSWINAFSFHQTYFSIIDLVFSCPPLSEQFHEKANNDAPYEN